jgi:predicted nucleic acid-binding protein
MPESSVFVDTNALLYLHDRKEEAKGRIVLDWFIALTDLQCAHLNLQVLNEAANVMLRGRWFDSPQIVYDIIDSLAALGADPIGWQEVELARRLHAALDYSWWDCLLLASALELGCTHFLSEDLQDGQRIELDGKGLTIVDPFAHTPEQILASP